MANTTHPASRMERARAVMRSAMQRQYRAETQAQWDTAQAAISRAARAYSNAREAARG